MRVEILQEGFGKEVALLKEAQEIQEIQEVEDWQLHKQKKTWHEKVEEVKE